MNKAVLTFSNGETLELYEDQLIVPISKLDINDDISISQCQTYKIWYHSSAGFIPSIGELLCKCNFFYLIDKPDKVYSSSAVVTIENL